MEKPPSVAPNNDVGLTPTTLDKHLSSHTRTQYDVDEGEAFEKFKRYFFRFQHLKESSPLTTRGNDMEANHGISTSKKRTKFIVIREFLQRIWEGLNHSSADLPVGGIDGISGLDSTSNKNSVEAKSTYQPTEKLKCEDKKTNWKNKFSPSKSFREFGESPATDKTTRHPDMHTGLPDMKQSFFKSIAGWWSGKSEKDQEGVCEPRKEVTTEDNFVHQIETIGVFSKGYFWDALESFLLTSKGAELISKSITREQLVHGLQKGGRWVLKDLSKAQLFELVNLMIVEKKWIEESILQMFPFRLTLAKQKCATSHCYNSNGLSSLFTGKISKSSIHRQPEQETYGHKSGSLGSSFAVTNSVNQPQNVLEFKSWFQKTYTRKEDVQPEDLEKMFESMFSIKLVPSSYGYPDLQSLIEVCANDDNYENKKIKSSPSGEKILFDCRKLLVELFDEYPDGFDMSIFKPAFLQRHGYVLESETLGYPNLASLLEIMPRVRIESSFVIPTKRFRSNSSSTNQLTIGTLDLTSLDNKGNAGINTSRESASEDCAWEEWRSWALCMRQLCVRILWLLRLRIEK
ncbi:uncharacterized protein LOC122049493 [Zingiber officinale]|uniref:uncharacterized protein LOC122049493 n=1 Tax=Zingiber officinale TaxID=94328 RepID=UPI001C4C4D3A|nr:uncharacterized protein LOC122049493 [Zingiber officinale]